MLSEPDDQGAAFAVCMRSAQLWLPCRTELLFIPGAVVELFPAGITVLLEGKALEGSGKGPEAQDGQQGGHDAVVPSPSHTQLRVVVQGLGRDWE